MNKKTALIFGISGQDGAYLAKKLLQIGYVVHGTSRDAEMATFKSLVSLGIKDEVTLHSATANDFRSVLQVIKNVEPLEIYNLAGQSSVSLSFSQPVQTLESIVIGTMNILECIRLLRYPVKFYNAGSGECFGETFGVPATETTIFNPKSPYAVAKSAAFWEVANYRDSYGIYACSGILFNHESPLRPDRFVTKKIVATAYRIATRRLNKLKIGNISIKRDWGWAPEYVDAMWQMLQAESPRDYVIATGVQTSLEDFVQLTFNYFGLDWKNFVEIDDSLFRPSDISGNFGDPQKAELDLGWKAKVMMPEIVKMMAEHEIANGVLR